MNWKTRIDQLENELALVRLAVRDVAKSCEVRAGSPAICSSEAGALRWVAGQLRKATDETPHSHASEAYDEAPP